MGESPIIKQMEAQPVMTNGPAMPLNVDRQYPPVKPFEKKSQLSDKLEQLLMLIYFAVAAILAFRFILAMFGARKESIFVSFVYQLTTPFMFPFTNMFGKQPQFAQYRIDFEVIVALVVYALVFLGLSKLVRILFK